VTVGYGRWPGWANHGGIALLWGDDSGIADKGTNWLV
jgi:hypothetical protein